MDSDGLRPLTETLVALEKDTTPQARNSPVSPPPPVRERHRSTPWGCDSAVTREDAAPPSEGRALPWGRDPLPPVTRFAAVHRERTCQQPKSVTEVRCVPHTGPGATRN